MLLASVALTGLVAFKGTVVVLAGVGLLGACCSCCCCCWTALVFCGCCSSPRKCKAADGATRRIETKKNDVVRMAPFESGSWEEGGGSLGVCVETESVSHSTARGINKGDYKQVQIIVKSAASRQQNIRAIC